MSSLAAVRLRNLIICLSRGFCHCSPRKMCCAYLYLQDWILRLMFCSSVTSLGAFCGLCSANLKGATSVTLTKAEKKSLPSPPTSKCLLFLCMQMWAFGLSSLLCRITLNLLVVFKLLWRYNASMEIAFVGKCVKVVTTYYYGLWDVNVLWLSVFDWWLKGTKLANVKRRFSEVTNVRGFRCNFLQYEL